MQRGKEFPYVFDAKIAERYIEIASNLTIAEGVEAKPLKLRGFQCFIIGSLFGWRKKRSNLRRFREAYAQISRQNGKSILAAVLALLESGFSGYRYGRILCAATKQEQADIVYEEIVKFISSEPDLQTRYKVTRHRHEITALNTKTVIKAISKEFEKKGDGFRSTLAICDELHLHETMRTYNLLLDGQIKVDNALTFAITTAGFDLTFPCYEHYKFCKKVLQGVIEKESLFVYICEMDEGDDIWQVENWAKANPLILWNEDNTLNQEMIARMAQKAIDAKEKGGNELVNFLTKSLNRWVTVAGEGYIDLEKWQACADDLTLEDMQGRECYLGIDLSSGGDLTSIALVFPLEDDKCYIYSHSYMPERRLFEHEKSDDVPYRYWNQQGLLTLTSGLYGIKTDYKKIIVELKELIERYRLKIVGCGYDPHNSAGFLSDLESIVDCDITEIVQTAKSLNDATVDFQLSVKAGLISFNRNDKLLTWNIANAVLTANSFGEVKIDKKKSTNRIDAIDALIDAWKLYFMNKEGEPDGEGLLDDWLEMTS